VIAGQRGASVLSIIFLRSGFLPSLQGNGSPQNPRNCWHLCSPVSLVRACTRSLLLTHGSPWSAPLLAFFWSAPIVDASTGHLCFRSGVFFIGSAPPPFFKRPGPLTSWSPRQLILYQSLVPFFPFHYELRLNDLRCLIDEFFFFGQSVFSIEEFPLLASRVATFHAA